MIDKQDIDNYIESFNLASDFIVGISSQPIYYYIFNIVSAAIVSYVSFSILSEKIKNIGDIKKHVETLYRIERKIRRKIKFFQIRYALVTGIGASALIDAQFGSFDIKTAIIYGFAGPYFVKNKVEGQIQSDISSETLSYLIKTKDEIKKAVSTAEKEKFENFLKDKIERDIQDAIGESNKSGGGRP